MAESAVKSVKALFKKAHKANEDPYLALLNHRATPSTTDGLSPARKLMNRELITRLSSMKPSVSNTNNHDTRMKLQAKKEKQKEFYDRKAKDLPTIPTGSTVRLHDGKVWKEKAKVISKSRMPRSYNVETESGKVLRRNRQHLLATKEPFVPKPEIVDDFVPPSNPDHDLHHHKEEEHQGSTSTGESHPREQYKRRLRESVKPPTRYGFNE